MRLSLPLPSLEANSPAPFALIAVRYDPRSIAARIVTTPEDCTTVLEICLGFGLIERYRLCDGGGARYIGFACDPEPQLLTRVAHKLCQRVTPCVQTAPELMSRAGKVVNMRHAGYDGKSDVSN